MDAAYYLDTVRTVFRSSRWHRGAGTSRVNGFVRGDADDRVFTIEGELDDLGARSDGGRARLCTGIPRQQSGTWSRRVRPLRLFSGRRWRESIYPELRAFIRTYGTP